MIQRTLQILLLCVLTLSIAYTFAMQNRMIIPVRIEQTNTTLTKLQSLGVNSNKIAEAVDIAARQSGLSPAFLIALMYSESTGNPKAVSSKGYKGLMQISHAVYYPDANLIIGAHIFNEKMRITKGDIAEAIRLYKGYPKDSERGESQVRKVLAMYDQLRKMEV